MPKGKGADYWGGLSFAPTPGHGDLVFSDETIEVIPIQRKKPKVVSIRVKAVQSIEVSSRQVAKSRAANVILFGVCGALAPREARMRALSWCI